MNDFMELMEQRRISYLILRDLFANKPTKEYLSALFEHSILELLPEESNQILKIEKEKLISMQRLIISGEKIIEDSPELQYYYLFENPVHLIAPLWESSYFHPEGLTFQEQTFEVRKKYLKYQFIANGFPQEPDDHLVTELDFMVKLIGLSIDEKKNKNEIIEDQIVFLKEHLLNWGGLLAERIHSYKEGIWFHSVINYFMRFLLDDFNYLSNIKRNDTTKKRGCFSEG